MLVGCGRDMDWPQKAAIVRWIDSIWQSDTVVRHNNCNDFCARVFACPMNVQLLLSNLATSVCPVCRFLGYFLLTHGQVQSLLTFYLLLLFFYSSPTKPISILVNPSIVNELTNSTVFWGKNQQTQSQTSLKSELSDWQQFCSIHGHFFERMKPVLFWLVKLREGNWLVVGQDNEWNECIRVDDFGVIIESMGCTDVDECAEKLDSCLGGIEVCINDLGLYHCQPLSGFDAEPPLCPPGYAYDVDEQVCIG